MRQLQKDLVPDFGADPTTISFGGSTERAWNLPIYGGEHHGNFQEVTLFIVGSLDIQFVTQGLRAHLETTADIDFSTADNRVSVPINVSLQKGDLTQSTSIKDVVSPLIVATSDAVQAKFNITIQPVPGIHLMHKARLRIIADTGFTAGSFTVEKVVFIGSQPEE